MQSTQWTCSVRLIAILIAVIGLGAPSVEAADTVTIQVSAVNQGGAEHRIVRTPNHTLPEGMPDTWSRGISLLATEGGSTIFVESLAVTGETPQPDDNDFTRINNAVQSVTLLGDGTEIRLLGVFDWTETNAMASWAAADYAVIAPGGVANVRIYADEPGDAVVLGPWELPDLDVYYEGFLHLFEGSYHGWTIENLELRGFDWVLAMFFTSSTDFDNVTVRNNIIELPVDIPGSHTLATGEPWQNIALHLSFGTNQIIEGNEVIIPGSAAAVDPEASSSVALQSNTSGGNVYDGLVIADNLIRVTGAQAGNSERVYGIWENAHGHTSNIEVSGNIFVNEAPDNDPALNLQRAFRVTSHSSDTSTVSYNNNIVSGANIGIHWLGDGYTFSPPASVLPVIVEQNTLLDNGTGVWVHTDDLAPGPSGPTKMSKAQLAFNRLAGNGVGVRSDDAEVMAENNWWGCNDGAGIGDCDPALYAGTAGFLDADPWLLLGLELDQTIIPVGAQATADASLIFNSDGADTSGLAALPDGTPVEFDASGGTMDPTEAETVSGMAASTFTAGAAPGFYGVGAAVDLASVEIPVTVTGDADLTMTMAPSSQVLDDGDNFEVAITVGNTGPNPAAEVSVAVDFPAELGGIGWICVGSGGGTCSPDGSGDIDDLADLPAGGSVTYTAIGALPDPFTGVLVVDGVAGLPEYLVDTNPSDNETEAEIRSIRVFDDGFESGDTSVWPETMP